MIPLLFNFSISKTSEEMNKKALGKGLGAFIPDEFSILKEERFAEIEIDEYDVDKGDLLSCPECGSTLEIAGISPIELELAAEEEDEKEAEDADDDLGDDNEDEDEEKEDWEE